ncbi:MAG TPA: hypothetical protein VL357_04385 [Rariglobus sp.]|jgi:hypothetical protein|nr:hypothetical protein [Rariglobus sp.]
MSLINEALKKAQRQRTDIAPADLSSAPSTTAGSPAPRIAKRRPPMPARTLVLLLVGGGLVLVTGGILTFVLLTIDSPAPVVAHAAPAVHPDKVQPVVATIPPPAPSPVAPPVPAPVKPVEVATAPAPVVAPVPEIVVPRPAVITPPQPVAPAKPVANPAVNTFVDAIRVTGVRISGQDSKVILNDRIVRLNDYVDRSLGLRLTKITQTSLGFTDSSGFEYTKDL